MRKAVRHHTAPSSATALRPVAPSRPCSNAMRRSAASAACATSIRRHRTKHRRLHNTSISIGSRSIQWPCRRHRLAACDNSIIATTPAGIGGIGSTTWQNSRTSSGRSAIRRWSESTGWRRQAATCSSRSRRSIRWARSRIASRLASSRRPSKRGSSNPDKPSSRLPPAIPASGWRWCARKKVIRWSSPWPRPSASNGAS